MKTTLSPSGLVALLAWASVLVLTTPLVAWSAAFEAGALVWVDYHGTPTEVLVVREDDSGVLVRFRTAEGVFDPSVSHQAYYAADAVRASDDARSGATAKDSAPPPDARPTPSPVTAPTEPTGPPLTRDEILSWLRAHVGPDPWGNPERDRLQNELAALIRARGADFRHDPLSDYDTQLTQAGANLSTVRFAIQANFGPPTSADWLLGTWDLIKIGGTVDFERDGALWRRNEIAATNGWLRIDRSHTYEWQSASGRFAGDWRAATSDEMATQYQGGAGVVILGGNGGWDWVVSRSTNPYFEGDSVDIQEMKSRGTMKEYGGRR